MSVRAQRTLMSTSTAKPRSHRLDRYNSDLGASSYVSEYDKKLHRKLSNRREHALLTRFSNRMDRGDWVLDLPSGFGRLSAAFASMGTRLVGADWSFSMLRERQDREQELGRLGCRARSPHFPFADRTFHCVGSIRLNHHLKSREERLAHLRELMRISHRYVVFTFFDSGSLKNRLRGFAVKYRGKNPKRTLSLSEVREVLAQGGFEVLECPALFPIGTGHRYVLAERKR